MNIGDKTAIFYITGNGLILAQRLKGLYPHAQVLKFKTEFIPELWNECKDLIFIMAAGIVVRTIAPLIKDKKTDPAVVVLDEKGKFVISLLSGHLGGANKLARKIANFLNREAVITTASDVNNMTAIDLWAKENNLVIEDWDLLPQITTRFLNNGVLRVYSEIDMNLPDDFLKEGDLRSADLIITNKASFRFCHPELISGFITMLKQVQHGNKEDFKNDRLIKPLYLRPRNLVIGIGCNSETSADEIEDVVKGVLEKNNLLFLSVKSIATIDKKGAEPGLISFADKYNLKINTFTPDELNSVTDITKSEAVLKATGANAVAEPAAILASGADKLHVQKQKTGNVTVAIAEKQLTVNSQQSAKKKGKIYIVGTGPGSIEHVTPYAQSVIKESDVIVGYGTYLDLIQELIKNKEVISTSMTKEIDRCRKAIELAISGRTVSLISGGDPGIYAMAGLVFEIIRTQSTKYGIQSINVEVIPGISALNACAAKLGAPLMHDFASISLSDRLTLWDVIEKRINLAAEADFVIILYNPKSKGRVEYINKASDIILKYRSPETPVGIAKGAMRENEKITITNLKNMLNSDIDMQTTIIIGNSQTFIWDGWMVTPRGYEMK